MKREIDNSMIIVGDFNTLSSMMFPQNNQVEDQQGSRRLE